VRVVAKLTAGARSSARERGKSDQLDAVAIARAALREGLDTLPIARLAGPELDVRLLVDHRERLVRQRTALINDLRWSLHDMWPELQIPSRVLTGVLWQDRIAGRLARAEQTARVRIARDELRRIRELTRSVDALYRELGRWCQVRGPPNAATYPPGETTRRTSRQVSASKTALSRDEILIRPNPPLDREISMANSPDNDVASTTCTSVASRRGR
jgi:hypothetical protein